MKICFLVSSLGSGGAERVASTLCNAWSARGDAVTLIPTYSGGGQPFYTLAESVEVAYLSDLAKTSGKSAGSYARRFYALRKAIAERSPDVIVSFLPNVNVAAILSTFFLGVPRIICERNDPSSRSPFEFWEVCSRLTYRFADMFTVQTEAVASKVHSRYPGLKRMRVVPNPLPDNIFSVREKTPGGRKILLSMGRFAPQKQVERTIRAFAELATGYPDWDLHIYGDGPVKASLEALIDALAMRGRIMLKGRTNEPWHVMAGADAFVMTSRHEGFPNALLEAMAIGLPCAVFDCPSGPREITRDGKDALLVPLNDHEALVKALMRLMDDEALRHVLGRQARESVRSRYSLQEVIRRWDRFFEEVGAIR